MFLDVFKFGQVTPLLKKPGADDKDMANFPPITNLTTIDKILECLSQNQIRHHIQGCPNFIPLQSAYGMLHSTEMAMTKDVNDLLVATDKKTPSVLLSLDISATFDILYHRYLIEPAKNFFELDDIVLEWLRSYLAGRTECVYWRPMFHRSSDDIGRSSRFGPRAAPVRHVHCPSRNIDQLLRNKLSTVRRGHTTIHHYRP